MPARCCDDDVAGSQPGIVGGERVAAAAACAATEVTEAATSIVGNSGADECCGLLFQRSNERG